MVDVRDSKRERYRRALKRDLGEAVDRLIDSEKVTDFSAASRSASVRAMSDAAETANRINDRIGPFFSSRRVEALLGVSRQAVSERARNHRLLRVTTSDGVKVFPSFQFTGGDIRRHLAPLLKVLLDSGSDPWTVAYWLTAPQSALGGRTALEIIDTTEENRASLIAAAQADVAQWRQGTA